MLNSKSFLAIDFGAGSLKLAEFEQNEAGGLTLKQYGIKSLGAEGAQETTREATILKALQEVLAEKSFGTKQVNACAPGFHVFSRFIKLPQVDVSKVTQIIRYEAQQNVPFPLEEVVWDYQILGTTASNELEVLLVAIKSEIVEGLFRVAEGAGLRINLVDVSQAALCNAFRFNYGDVEGCAMLLDIGAKTSNVLFFEKGKVYSRSVAIGANSITQDFGNEAKLKFGQAEAIKIEKGFVSLGGAYEEPEDPQAAAISKIARNVMTRLHLQINQTVQFYRSQGGSAPQRVFLSGGASIMPYTAQFFEEKLNVHVEYFNPFRNIELAPAVDLDDLSKYAHSFGEVVGLGLRELAHCPVEMNLMPRVSLKRQELARKKPYFAASIVGVVLIVAFIGYTESQIANTHRAGVDTINKIKEPLAKNAKDYDKAVGDRNALVKQIDALADQVEYRSYWADLLMGLKKSMLQIENECKEASKNIDTNADAGVWVEAFCPMYPPGDYAVSGQTFSGVGTENANVSAGGGGGGGAVVGTLTQEMLLGRRDNRGRPPVAPVASAATPATNEISQIGVRIRAMDREKFDRNANTDLAFAVQRVLTNSGFFTEAKFVGERQASETTGTFSFDLALKLKRPFKL